MQDPRPVLKDNFKIILMKPKPSSSIIDADCSCDVTVVNDITPAVVEMLEEEVKVKQSDGELSLHVLRSEEMKGRVVVPWKILPESEDSVYMNVTGN